MVISSFQTIYLSKSQQQWWEFHNEKKSAGHWSQWKTCTSVPFCDFQSLCVCCNLLMTPCDALSQGCPKSVLKGRCPADFAWFPALTHLILINGHHQLVIKVSTCLLMTQTLVSGCVEGRKHPKPAGHWPSRTDFGHPWSELSGNFPLRTSCLKPPNAQVLLIDC